MKCLQELSLFRFALLRLLGLTAFGALAAYDTGWIGSGQPVSAAQLKQALDDIQPASYRPARPAAFAARI